jgi:DNA-binding NtrC family response regulator
MMIKNQASARLLLVDDDPVFCQDMVNTLGTHYELQLAADAEAAIQTVIRSDPDLVLLDLELGAGRPNGMTVLARLRAMHAPPPVIMLTVSADVKTIVHAIQAGAFHFCPKPPRAPELRNLIDLGLQDADMRRQMRHLKAELLRLQGGLVAEDRRMLAVLQDVERVAPMATTVLITGPCGAGKEMFARKIHDLSDRRSGIFVGVNCAAIPQDLIESELFGYEPGAFTGAIKQRKGAFEQANGGTLFLDEIGDAPQRLHTKLLRVLEEREFTPVGGEKPVKTNVRVVSATSKDLEAEVASGRFCEALFYRLNVFRIQVPGLDERPGDIEALARHFLIRHVAEAKKKIAGFSPEALAYLRSRKWPGNVRQLRNLVESAVIRCDGDRILLGDLAFGAGTVGNAPPAYHEAKERAMRGFKREYLSTQLRVAGGSIARAADLSGIKRQAFSKMLRDEGLDAGEA